MSLVDALSGVLHVRPGQPLPHNIVGSRPDWAETLTRGRPVSAAPAVLASAFSLCGHAHRLCAQLALQAAAGQEARVIDAPSILQQETLREHLRRIGLDWVRHLGAAGRQEQLAAESAASLQACPALTRAHDDLGATRDWLQAQWLAMPAEDWLHHWQQGGTAWLAEWAGTTAGWLPNLLASARVHADVATVPSARLLVHAEPSALQVLADQLRDEASFTRRPRWQGACAETGPWARLNDEPGDAASPWQRLGARLAELARLTLPDEPGRAGAGWLRHGALPLGACEGLAWVEMARGLLVHYAQLEPAVPEPRVARYRVLAPTEWNFHPEGAVAQALQNLTGDDAEARAVALMAAYDPCVRFDVELQPHPPETTHA